MPALARIWNACYILVPDVGIANRDAILLGRAACRVAYQAKLKPVFPILYYGGFMTEEELDRQLTAESWREFRRCSRIWLCSPSEHPVLDPLSHDMLLSNEGLLLTRPRSSAYSSVFARRIPVYWYQPGFDGEAVKVSAMERSDVGRTLRMNITSGLFRGVAI